MVLDMNLLPGDYMQMVVEHVFDVVSLPLPVVGSN